MANRPNVWKLYLQAEATGSRPSDLLGIEDAYLRYCLDEAVWHFGTTVRQRMNDAGEKKGKHDNDKKRKLRVENALRDALGIQRRYAQIPASGGAMTGG